MDSERLDRRRVAFVNLTPHIGALPAVVSAMGRLVERGYQLDLISIASVDHIPTPHFSERQITLCPLPARGKLKIPGLGFLRIIAEIVRLSRARGGYACFFGIDQGGMIVATLASMFVRTPAVYFSMELYPSSEARGWRKRLNKSLERICNRFTWLTLIQDDERAACLLEDNRIDRSQIMIVPNSPLGRAARNKSSYLNDRLGIAGDRQIVLYAGNIIDWAMCLELAESALTWPAEWVLVLHGYAVSSQAAYLDKIKRLATDSRVVLSLDMVPYEDVERLYSSAAIGVALYDSKKGANYANIAGASGKLIRYLKCGLPIVTSDSPGLRRLVERSQCGVCIGDAGEIKSAVARVLADYSQFSSNAVRCYNEEFEFAKYFDRVIDKIDEL
ncbi:MAG: glycosyltransferase [Thermoflexales bacterium]|nr:glycosyltransferase [Thermoflexales bacterium]